MPLSTIPVSCDDMWTLLLSTVRYSLGRSTYMTVEAIELVARYCAALTREQGLQIVKEIRQEIELYEKSGRHLPDKNIWYAGSLRLECLFREKPNTRP